MQHLAAWLQEVREQQPCRPVKRRDPVRSAFAVPHTGDRLECVGTVECEQGIERGPNPPACDSCGADLADPGQDYTLRIDLFASAGPLEPDDDDLRRDHAPEFEWLLARLQHMSAAEVLAEERRVFERFTFRLCPTCRQVLADRLRTIQLGIDD